MIEELQRSVIFFSRANNTLKQQNEELSRLLIQSQTQVVAIENGQQPSSMTVTPVAESPQPAAMQQQPKAEEQFAAIQQAQAQAVATQAVLESQVREPSRNVRRY
jgi:hypothetical protein